MKISNWFSVVASAALVLTLGFAAAPGSASAATIFSDSFGAGSTDGSFDESPAWTEGGNSGDDAEKRASGGGNDSASPDGGRFAIMFGEDGYICATINAVGYASVQLAYHWRGDSDAEGDDDGIVEFKTTGTCSGGGGWTQLQSHDLNADGSWTSQAAFANVGFSDASFLLRFRANSSQDDEHFRVDGVTVTGDEIVTTGTLTVTKVVVGGPLDAGSVPLFVDGMPVTSDVATTTSSGNHVVSETPQANYVASFGGACDGSGNVNVPAGGSASCTITNTYVPQTGTITVTKVVDNALGGTSTTSDFQLLLDGVAHDWGVASTSLVGAHVVSEATVVPNYVPTFSGACDSAGNVTVASSTDSACVVTNTYTPPPTTGDIVVVKDVVEPDGVTDTADATTFTATLSGTTTQVSFGEGLAGVFYGVLPGDYDLGELAAAGYQLIGISPSTTTTVTVGATTTVTFTNRQLSNEGELTVDITVIGGSLVAGDFELFIDGATTTDGVATTTAAGDHTVTVNPETNYDITFSGGCDVSGVVSVPAEGSATCEVTATDVSPTTGTIVVIKDVIAENDGPADDLTSFTVSLNGAATATVAEGSNATFDNLAPGDYTLTEESLFGYELVSISPSTTTSILAGDTVYVTVTNRQQGTTGDIVVVKNVVDEDGVSDISDAGASFTVVLDGATSSSVSEGVDAVYYGVSFGEHFITENPQDGYELVSIEPATATVSVGGTTTVVVTNRKFSTGNDVSLGDQTEGGNPGGRRSSSSGRDGGGSVLGAATDDASCEDGAYLLEYIWPNRPNNPAEVRKLQLFLNEGLDVDLEVSGVYDAATQAAVGRFQVENWEVILKPWFGDVQPPVPTYNVFKTTLWLINDMECKGIAPFPIV